MKTALITGANSGIGLATAKALAAQGFDLILMVRSVEKGQKAAQIIKKSSPESQIEIVTADLADLDSVRQAAAVVVSKYPKLDRLINNAGYSATEIKFTKAGYEKSFVANHLGHFVLTNALMPLLKASDEARVISVSSAAHSLGSVARFFVKNNKGLTLVQSYGDGKLANILFTKALAKRTSGSNVTAYSLHPGVVDSNFGGDFTGLFKWGWALMKPFSISTEEGAQTSIFLATAPIESIKQFNGAYFDKSRPKNTRNRDITDANADLVWQKSEVAAGH